MERQPVHLDWYWRLALGLGMVNVLIAVGDHATALLRAEHLCGLAEQTDELGKAAKPVFDNLNTYEVTMHFNGQSTVALDGDHATGQTYCLAHHVTVDGGKRRLMIASLRYLDTFVKVDDAWLFGERLLYVDWVDERPIP